MSLDVEIVPITSDLLTEVTGYAASDFPRLRALDLHLRGKHKNQKIRRIDSLAILPNLLQLNLSYNLITKIEGLDRLVHLVELNLAENSISAIEGLDHMKSLERLNLSGNKIERIPPSIVNLISLTHFRIARNQLAMLSDVQSLGQLEKLKNLRLDNNPMMEEAEEASLFVIYHIRSLLSLNGVEITADDREEARLRFATDEVAHLR